MNDKTTYSIFDPASVKQSFEEHIIQILCCRYWWLQHWEHETLSRPYWRIYYNDRAGAFIKCNDEVIPLTPNNIYIIPPNTAYSSYLVGHDIARNRNQLEGGAITDSSVDMGVVNQIFIHFNIGFSCTKSLNKIYVYPVDQITKTIVEELTDYLKKEVDYFDSQITCLIRSLINIVLYRINLNNHRIPTEDIRVIDTLRYIEENLESDLSNVVLSSRVHMANNAFQRLFKQEMRETLQRYILHKRIDSACLLLHHTTMNIDEIAMKVGFSNRFHFSRQFSLITSVSPARYRRFNG